MHAMTRTHSSLRIYCSSFLDALDGCVAVNMWMPWCARAKFQRWVVLPVEMKKSFAVLRSSSWVSLMMLAVCVWDQGGRHSDWLVNCDLHQVLKIVLGVKVHFQCFDEILSVPSTSAVTFIWLFRSERFGSVMWSTTINDNDEVFTLKNNPDLRVVRSLLVRGGYSLASLDSATTTSHFIWVFNDTTCVPEIIDHQL